jgi:alginate O-acetyltransferase complex protein AlgI
MVFSSNVFLFLFLPIFLGLYYLSGQRYRNLLLLVASYVFYAWWRVDFLALFAAVTLWNYWIGLKVGAAGVRTKPAQRWLLLGVAVDLCILGYFKYANFGVDSINLMMKSAGLEPFILTHVLCVPRRHPGHPQPDRLCGVRGDLPASDCRPGVALSRPGRPVQQPHPHPR